MSFYEIDKKQLELDKIQLDGFDDWFYKHLMICESALSRKVLYENKENLKHTWMNYRPMIEPAQDEKRDWNEEKD